MNSRDRILTAISHQTPDRVPVDFSGHRSSGINALAYTNLRSHLGLTEKPVRIYDVIQQLAIVDEDVLDFFGIDTIELGRGFLLDDGDWKDWIMPDGRPCQIPVYVHMEKRGEDWFLLSDSGRELGVQKPGCLYFDQVYYPLEGVDSSTPDVRLLEEVFNESMWSAVAHPGGHLKLDDAGLTEMTRRAEDLRLRTDRAIIGLFGGSIFEVPQYLFGSENFLMTIALYPEATHRLMENLTAIYLKNLEKWLGAVGPYIDIILFGGEDMGGQNGPLISPAMYREFFKPYHTRLWKRAKELAGVPVQLHCCGGVRPILDDLIDAGMDALNPVQITAAGMDTAGLKKDFGDRMTFWGGGCDTREMLGRGTPDQIKMHVRRQVELLKRGGGFVFQQVHNIMANVPPANIVAMFEALGSDS